MVVTGGASAQPGTADLAPGLATSWEPSADGKEWTFTLAEGVKFSDGTDFNGEAVLSKFGTRGGQAAVKFQIGGVGLHGGQNVLDVVPQLQPTVEADAAEVGCHLGHVLAVDAGGKTAIHPLLAQ